MARYLVNAESLGKRLIGYQIYHSDTKEIVGYTEKQVLRTLREGKVIHGFILAEDEYALDGEGFHTTNIMMRTGMNNLKPLFELEYPMNQLYVVIKQIKQKGKNSFEVINSRYGRTVLSEEMIRTYLEMGIISGGVYLDDKGKMVVCPGVEIEEVAEEEKSK